MDEYIDIPLLKGAIVRKKANQSKQVYFDISFQINPSEELPELAALIFQNYYCSAISIAQENSLSEFVTILENFELMGNAYSVTDSQKWFTINSKQFNSRYVPGRKMRMYLFQPASIWQKFEIHHLRAVSTKSESPSNRLSSTVSGSGCMDCSNVLKMIAFDWKVLQEAADAQKDFSEPIDLAPIIAEYKRNSSKKNKKKDKKRAQQAANDDDMGIALATYTKDSEMLDSTVLP
jgi:hypothetical protein